MSERNPSEESEAIASLPQVYANTVQVVISPWDLQIRFGQDLPTTNGSAITKWAVQVVQGLPHAKALLSILSEQINSYEEKFGPIPVVIGTGAKLERVQYLGEEAKSVASSTSQEPPSEPTPAAPRG